MLTACYTQTHDYGTLWNYVEHYPKHILSTRRLWSLPYYYIQTITFTATDIVQCFILRFLGAASIEPRII